jgi:hypothetical protein
MTREQEEALAQVAHDLHEWENRIARDAPVPSTEWRNFDLILRRLDGVLAIALAASLRDAKTSRLERVP